MTLSCTKLDSDGLRPSAAGPQACQCSGCPAGLLERPTGVRAHAPLQFTFSTFKKQKFKFIGTISSQYINSH